MLAIVQKTKNKNDTERKQKYKIIYDNKQNMFSYSLF